MGIKDRWMQVAEKLKGAKRMEKWTVFFLTGLLLLVIALPTDPEREVEKPKEQEESEEDRHDAAYEETMETRIKELLTNVNGVGTIDVMVTLASGEEKIIEKDRETSEETGTQGEGGTSRKTLSETTVYTGGSGEESPYVTKKMTPEIQGIVVIAEGGGNPVVVEEITEALQALFGIESHKIKVMKHR